jgi:putative GTP pyrophosphokinase
MADLEALLREFSEREEILESSCRKVHTLIEDLLHAEGVRVHSVTFRVKKQAKLREKLQRPNKNYSSLEQVTDLVGLRIITYYEDEVDRVASIIRREFAIDEKNSVDKRIQEDPEKFTYSSLHFVCSINEMRLALGEYQRYLGIKFEIQIRSILQHAWAEIQHDWYDLQDRLPRDIQRRFSRLAGLLDLADSEFLEIRKKKVEYERSISVRLTAKVPDMSDVPLDSVSIQSFILQNNLVKELDNRIAQIRGREILVATQNYNVQADLAIAAGIKTLEELRASLEAHAEDVLEYIQKSKEYFEQYFSQANHIAQGACLINLFIMLLSLQGDEKAIELIERAKVNISPNLDIPLKMAREILKNRSN